MAQQKKAVDPAIEEAINKVLNAESGLGPDFRKQFAKLIANSLTGNYGDSDVRGAMDAIHVESEADD